ncbi:MAG: MFS transporter [Balneolales bacterium]|nr:MFS transporter [Balneolales bacterium]
MYEQLSIREKVAYALGDGAANIAWRGVSTFLFIFYTDVFGIDPVSVGLLMLVARSFDGISDVGMGIIGDKFTSKHGKFRPWVLWTAIPLALILSLLFTTPDFTQNGKIIYAYVTYILFTLIYTANNVPYGALMAVMTGDDKERISLGSFRMAGAFAGGMLVQGSLLYLVLYFGSVNPTISIQSTSQPEQHVVTVVTEADVSSARINLVDGVGNITWYSEEESIPEASSSLSFDIQAGEEYIFLVSGLERLEQEDLSVINQQQGYSKSIYTLSVLLALFMCLTFLGTKERVFPDENQKFDIIEDLKQLVRNKPWAVLLGIGLTFNVYNSIKQGVILIYFAHFLDRELLAATYLIVLSLASIAGAILATPLGKKFGKKALFIYALMFSGLVGSLLIFCGPDNLTAIFVIGTLSEVASAMFPTLFFVMLGDAADYSEWKNNRRATGLVYSAGSLATKFGGGIGGAIIGFVLAYVGYNGMDPSSIEAAKPGIVWLMSWIPGIIALLGAALMLLYPLDTKKMETITNDLTSKRQQLAS